MREFVAKQADRQRWIDIYKGLAIILVVLGHLEIPGWLYDFIFLFHMYAFFFIAGVTFKVKQEQTFGMFFLDNVKKLYVPYLFFAFAWDAVHIVTTLYIQGNFDFSFGAICKNILSVLLGGAIPSNAELGPAWFLLALFVVRVVCWLIVKCTKGNCYIFGVIAAVLFAIGYICPNTAYVPFKIIPTFTAYVFVFLGYTLKKLLQTFTAKKITLLLLSIVCFGVVAIVSVFSEGTVVLVGNILPANFMVTLIGGILGCAGLMFLSFLLARVPKISDLLMFYGVNSLIIMGVHSEINFALRFVFDKIGLAQIYRVIAIFLITLVFVIPISKIINKYFPALAGRGKSKV